MIRPEHKSVYPSFFHSLPLSICKQKGLQRNPKPRRRERAPILRRVPRGRRSPHRIPRAEIHSAERNEVTRNNRSTGNRRHRCAGRRKARGSIENRENVAWPHDGVRHLRCRGARPISIRQDALGLRGRSVAPFITQLFRDQSCVSFAQITHQFRPALKAWRALGAVNQNSAYEELIDTSPRRVSCPRLFAARGILSLEDRRGVPLAMSAAFSLIHLLLPVQNGPPNWYAN